MAWAKPNTQSLGYCCYTCYICYNCLKVGQQAAIVADVASVAGPPPLNQTQSLHAQKQNRTGARQHRDQVPR
jgi:hypothetical protein